MTRVRLQLIACQVFQRELKALAATAKTDLTISELEMGLHEGTPAQLRDGVQVAIDAVPPGRYDAVGLVYGLCNLGIVGLVARTTPVVVPRAHDCLGVLLGSNQQYLKYLDANPGTYFQSPGWLDHLPADRVLRQQNVPMGPGIKLNREELVARYGEDNADFLLEQFSLQRTYSRLGYISTPVPEADKLEQQASNIARGQGWEFDRLAGDLGWLQRLVDGDWNQREFLTLQPGERLAASYDDQLIRAEKV